MGFNSAFKGLNVVIFPPDSPRRGRPKTVATPKIIDQIHELILEDRRISAKSIADFGRCSLFPCWSA
jgi:hypothetical protein